MLLFDVCLLLSLPAFEVICGLFGVGSFCLGRIFLLPFFFFPRHYARGIFVPLFRVIFFKNILRLGLMHFFSSD